MPYQVFGDKAGAAALMREWIRVANVRSSSTILAIAARQSASPSPLPPRRLAALRSATRSRIAAFSSSVKVAVVFLAALDAALDGCFAFLCGIRGSQLPHEVTRKQD